MQRLFKGIAFIQVNTVFVSLLNRKPRFNELSEINQNGRFTEVQYRGWSSFSTHRGDCVENEDPGENFV